MNPFLDSLGHSGLKNKGLPPGGGSGCFQSSQDAMKYLIFLNYVNFTNLTNSMCKFVNELSHSQNKSKYRNAVRKFYRFLTRLKPGIDSLLWITIISKDHLLRHLLDSNFKTSAVSNNRINLPTWNCSVNCETWKQWNWCLFSESSVCLHK